MAIDTTATQGSPYWDDYSDKGNSSKNYLRVLFQPGRAVQTRELNQLQSAIQDQIDKFGQHVFQDGSKVLDGEIDVDNKIQWIDVTLTANGALVAADTTRPLVGKKIYCRASGSGYVGADVSATIMDYELKSDNDYRFYVRYTSDTTNFAGGSRTFADFKTGEALSGGGITIASDAAIGNGTGAITSGYAFKMHNAKGIYFVKGYFVEAPEQTKYVDTTSSAPLTTIAGSVGFLITEPIINATNDSTLYDNATGSPNFSAPGADRYTMQLTLVLISDNTDIDRDNNVVATTVLNTVDVLPIATESKPVIPVDTKYSRIGETLALRTFEESGDYALQPFQLDLREDFNNGFNNGRDTSGDKAKFTVTLEPSTAYVKGQRIEILNKQTLTQNKGRTTNKTEDTKIQATFGSYIEVDGIDFLPKLVNTETYTISTGDSTSSYTAGTAIATCKIKGIEYTGKKYRLYVYDVAQASGNTTSIPISSGRTIAGDSASAENDGSNRFYGFLNADSRGMNIEQTGENNNIFYLPYEIIKTLTPSGVASTAIKIPVRDKLQNQAVSSNTLAFTITSAELYHDNPNEYIVVNESTGAPVAVTNVALSTTTSTLDTATLTLGLSSGNVDVTFSKRITGSAGTKTLKTDGSTAVGAAAYAIGDTIALSNSDIISVTSINSAADGSGTDLSDNFIMEDGGTATTYGNGRLICIKALSSTAVNVAYRYLEHTTPGSFFSVDSYPLDDTGSGDLDRAELPFVDGGSASDFLDFRHTDHSDLDPNGIIEIGGAEYYLSRHDRIVLNAAGKFIYLEGNSIAHAPLEVPADSMMLYELYVPPFTNSVQNIQISYKNNKRYTMRDIGKLEKRVKSLEYYTSLSLLEQATSDKQIFDNTGDRFKNGILVDEFKGHGKADTRDPGYAIAVDPEEGVLRPSFTSQDLGIRNTATNLTTDATFGTTPKTGAANDPVGEDLIRLPITSVRTLINQDKAAVAVSVNPFDVASWVGSVKLSPSTDNWRDTRRRPDVIIQQDGNVDALLNLMNEQLASQGTRWNDWNTTWSGKITKTDLGEISGASAVARGLGSTVTSTTRTAGRRIRFGRSWIGRGRWRTVTTRTTSFPTFNGGTVSTKNLNRARVRIEQKAEKGTATRSGIRQFAEEGPPITTSLGDKIVDVSFVPFIRSREVYFHGSGFKPNTTLYAFFDGVNISSYATGDSSYTRRAWRNNTTRRDRFNDSPGNITSSAIVSDSRGRVSGSFIIPNQRRLRFKTGEREFRLIDNTSNDLSVSTTYAMATYTARGMVNTLQETIISTRSVKVSERRVKESKTVTRTEQAVKAIRHVDPLAQTFVVDPDQYPAGVFLKDVDLFFRQKHSALPVRIQIVPCENGIPTQNVIPFSEVEKEFDEVNVSTNATSATTFTFESLVHLKGGVEYAIVVLSNSPEYFLWHSEVGKDDVTTGKRITKNPYTGVALKSANASTWTPDQNKDFKFHLRYAKFNESNLTPASPYSRTVGNASTHTAYGDFVTISPENVYGAALSSSNQLRIDSINLIAESVVLPETGIRYLLKVKSQANVTTTYEIEPNEVLELDETIKYDDPSQLELYCELLTGNEFLTPIIDLDRLSLLTFANTINGGANLTGETGATHGTAKARYITNMVRLDSAASRVDCYLDVERPAPQANVEAYIRFERDSAFTKLDSVEIPITDGFSEVHFRTPDSAAAAEYNFELFQIKLVLSTHTGGDTTGDDSATIPRCMNFRAIATA